LKGDIVSTIIGRTVKLVGIILLAWRNLRYNKQILCLNLLFNCLVSLLYDQGNFLFDKTSIELVTILCMKTWCVSFIIQFISGICIVRIDCGFFNCL